jgi:O-antigen ligase
MNPGPLVGTAVGLAITLGFVTVAVRDLRRGVLAYLAVGFVPWIHMGAFGGNQLVQGLLLGEVLATALIGVWLFKRPSGIVRTTAATPFNRWLLLLLPASVLSLVSGLAWLDHTVPQQNVKLSVSFGQLLLFIWPVGVYLVTADQIRDPRWIRPFRRVVFLLASPQFLLALWPDEVVLFGFSRHIGLVASPIAFAMMFQKGVPRWKLLLLAALALVPLVQGFRTNKALHYLFVTICMLVILWYRARRLSMTGAFVLGGALLVWQFLPSESLPGFLQAAVDAEAREQSLGGRSGRVALAQDAIAIWSRFPLLGVGPGNSYPYMLRYSVLGTPHSQYFGFLLELGVVGLGLFLAFVLGCIRHGVRMVRVRRSQEEDAFLLGWFASFVAWSVCSLTGDYMLQSIRNGGLETFSWYYIHWLFLGAAMGISRRRRAQAPPVRVRIAPAPGAWRQRPHAAL